MSKYLPNNSELRIAIFTAMATILLVVVGHTLVRGIWGGMYGGMGMDCMNGGKCSMMEKMGRMGGMMDGKMELRGGVMKGGHMMPDGSMMMNDDHEMNMMDMTMSDMVGMLEGKTGKALEKEFIIGMIPHHQGAVDMSKKMLQDKTISAEMRKFAEQIVAAQESEIRMMNEWLKKY